MKYFVVLFRILIAGLTIWLGVSILYPHHNFRVESFEYSLRTILHLNWLIIPFASRLLIGLLFCIAFLLLFYWKKIKWIKYFTPLALSIPFIINPVFPKNFKDLNQEKNTFIHGEIEVVIKNDDKTIVALLTPSCRYCINAGKKLVAAKKTSKNFPSILLAGVTEEGVKELKGLLNYDFEYVLLGIDLFLELSEYQFPKIHVIENQKLKKVYDGHSLNYYVLNQLSKKD